MLDARNACILSVQKQEDDGRVVLEGEDEGETEK
jgi:hypothetical protein